MLKRFGSVTVLNGHIHQIVQKVEGNMTFHLHAPPASRSRSSSVLGITSVSVRVGDKPHAITDSTLAS